MIRILSFFLPPVKFEAGRYALR